MAYKPKLGKFNQPECDKKIKGYLAALKKLRKSGGEGGGQWNNIVDKLRQELSKLEKYGSWHWLKNWYSIYLRSKAKREYGVVAYDTRPLNKR